MLSIFQRLSAVVVLWVAVAVNVSAAEKRPNLLLAIADHWSHGHAVAYGCAWVNTPRRIDRLRESWQSSKTSA